MQEHVCGSSWSKKVEIQSGFNENVEWCYGNIEYLIRRGGMKNSEDEMHLSALFSTAKFFLSQS